MIARRGLVNGLATGLATGVALAVFGGLIPSAALAFESHCPEGQQQQLLVTSASSKILEAHDIFANPVAAVVAGDLLCATGPSASNAHSEDTPVIVADSGVAGYVRTADTTPVPVGFDTPDFEGDAYAAVSAQGPTAGVFGAVGDTTIRAVLSLPSWAVMGGGSEKVLELAPGAVIQIDPSIEVEGRVKFSTELFNPALLADGSTGWVTTTAFEPLPAADSTLTEKWTPQLPAGLFNDPTSALNADPDDVIEAGTTVRSSPASGGWRVIEIEGDRYFAQVPPLREDDESAGWWDRTKETAKDLYGDAKEKAKEVVKTGKEKVAEDATHSVWASVTNTPALLATVVLAVFALLAAAFRRHPVTRFIPWGRMFIIPALSIALAITATAIAPAVWTWLPWAAAATVLPGAISLAFGICVLRGGPKPVWTEPNSITVTSLRTWMPPAALLVVSAAIPAVVGVGQAAAFVASTGAAAVASAAWILTAPAHVSDEADTTSAKEEN